MLICNITKHDMVLSNKSGQPLACFDRNGPYGATLHALVRKVFVIRLLHGQRDYRILALGSEATGLTLEMSAASARITVTAVLPEYYHGNESEKATTSVPGMSNVMVHQIPFARFHAAPVFTLFIAFEDLISGDDALVVQSLSYGRMLLQPGGTCLLALQGEARVKKNIRKRMSTLLRQAGYYPVQPFRVYPFGPVQGMLGRRPVFYG